MKRVYFLGFFLYIISCKEAKQLDLSKIDRNYFLGKYKTDLNTEQEIITLNENGYYDYQKESVVLKNQGKWELFLNIKYPKIDLNNYPNYSRKTKLDMNNDSFIDLPLYLNYSVYFSLGNLQGLVLNGAGEQDLIFEKLDKEKNKNYLKQ